MESSNKPPTTVVMRRRNFPSKLYAMLHQIELEGRDDIVSWQPHGRAFMVRNVQEFEHIILPRFFRHTNMLSFKRQLHIYDFIRIKDGIDQHAYYNPNFLRDQPERLSKIKRAATKGHNRTGNSMEPPNFYETGETTSTVTSNVASTSSSVDVKPDNTTIMNNICNNKTGNNRTSMLQSQNRLQETTIQSIPHPISVEAMMSLNQVTNIMSGNAQPQHHTDTDHQINATATTPIADRSHALSVEHLNQIKTCIELLLSSILQYNINNGGTIHTLTQPPTTNPSSGLTSLLILASLLSDNDETVRRNVFSTLLRTINQQQNQFNNESVDVVVHNNNSGSGTIFNYLNSIRGRQNYNNTINTNFQCIVSLLRTVFTERHNDIQNHNTIMSNMLLDHSMINNFGHNNNNNNNMYHPTFPYYDAPNIVVPILSNIQELSRTQDTFRDIIQRICNEQQDQHQRM